MTNEENQNDKSDYEILPDDYPKYDLSFKIIIIGDSGVGKSCLSVKATKNIFENNYLATVGFEFFNFNIKLGERIIRLQIWDTCGQEIYRSLITNFYRNSSLAQERDERMHACRREQACGVVFGNQRSAFDFGMAVALEKINEHSSQFSSSHHSNSFVNLFV